MAYRGERQLKCPVCHKRGVRVRFAPHGEDHFYCVYCDFNCFCSGNSCHDTGPRWALAQANPDRPESVGVVTEKPTWPSYMSGPPEHPEWYKMEP